MALPALKDKRGINPIHQKIKIIEEARVERARERESEKKSSFFGFIFLKRNGAKGELCNATQRSVTPRTGLEGKHAIA